MEQKPSVGRIVLAIADPAFNNGADVAPAIITRVWSDTMVNVRVLADSDAVPWRTSVSLYADRDAVEEARAARKAELQAVGHSGDVVMYAAYWPPRVDPASAPVVNLDPPTTSVSHAVYWPPA